MHVACLQQRWDFLIRLILVGKSGPHPVKTAERHPSLELSQKMGQLAS